MIVKESKLYEPPLGPIAVEGAEDHWEVEKITQRCIRFSDGKPIVKYTIKWRGWDNKFNQTIDKEELRVTAPDIVNKYEADNPVDWAQDKKVASPETLIRIGKDIITQAKNGTGSKNFAHLAEVPQNALYINKRGTLGFEMEYTGPTQTVEQLKESLVSKDTELEIHDNNNAGPDELANIAAITPAIETTDVIENNSIDSIDHGKVDTNSQLGIESQGSEDSNESTNNDDSDNSVVKPSQPPTLLLERIRMIRATKAAEKARLEAIAEQKANDEFNTMLATFNDDEIEYLQNVRLIPSKKDTRANIDMKKIKFALANYETIMPDGEDEIFDEMHPVSGTKRQNVDNDSSDVEITEIRACEYSKKPDGKVKLELAKESNTPVTPSNVQGPLKPGMGGYQVTSTSTPRLTPVKAIKNLAQNNTNSGKAVVKAPPSLARIMHEDGVSSTNDQIDKLTAKYGRKRNAKADIEDETPKRPRLAKRKDKVDSSVALDDSEDDTPTRSNSIKVAAWRRTVRNSNRQGTPSKRRQRTSDYDRAMKRLEAEVPKNHPLYERIAGEIDRVDRKQPKNGTFASNGVVRSLKLKCQQAEEAYRTNGPWEGKLPDKATVMACKYYAADGALNGTVTGLLSTVGRLDLAQVVDTKYHGQLSKDNDVSSVLENFERRIVAVEKDVAQKTKGNIKKEMDTKFDELETDVMEALRDLAAKTEMASLEAKVDKLSAKVDALLARGNKAEPAAGSGKAARQNRFLKR
ncbi:hypothetical protein CHU98_g4832 [Xylaria longipes]|nr:hypothetical protein CHU98_g4832 [Xylaria longipes]